MLFNHSSRVLRAIEESVLSKVLKFAIPPIGLSKERYLYTFEKLYTSLQSFPIYEDGSIQLLSFKDKLRNLALSSFEKFEKRKPKPILSQDEMDAIIIIYPSVGKYCFPNRDS